MWDPARYQQFAAERARPFTDLLNRVGAVTPGYVVDLGCGPGDATALLAERWPQAYVLGLDSSPEMIEAARPHGRPGQLEFRLGDLRTWRPDRPVDVLVTNAVLQWIPGHVELLPSFVEALAPGGWLAVQVPGNQQSPAHAILSDLRASPRWLHLVGERASEHLAIEEPETYLDALAGLGCTVDAWETTYLHLLPGEDAVLTWMSGTALRPVLAELDERERAEFLAEYGARLREAYPRRPYGTVLPFRRVFAVARGT
jgi:trans-aconitate 2-methyltransferase